MIYDALDAGNLAVVFHAAETGDGERPWEKRYSAVIGIDLPNDRIIIDNPDGFVLRPSLTEFIRSTRFENYEMSFFDILSFAFRLYQRNTVFIIDRVGAHYNAS